MRRVQVMQFGTMKVDQYLDRYVNEIMKLIHYTPDKSGCYVYARVKDNKTVLVLMNGTDQNQTLDMNRFHEVVKDYRSGKDIITDTIVAIDTAVHIPARGVYILEFV